MNDRVDRRTPAERAYDRYVDPLGWYSQPGGIWGEDDEAAQQADLAAKAEKLRRQREPRDCKP